MSVKITILGNAPHEQWFAARLQARGFDILRASDSPHPFTQLAGAAAGPAMLVDRLIIDTGTSSIHARQQLAAACQEAGLGYAELAGQWQALGVQFGFVLFVGADAATRDQLTPIFDALAPQPGGWLPCGPAGSARFAAQLFDALSMACALACQAGWSQPGQMPQPPDWGAFFLQQQTLAQRLLELAQCYLACIPEEAGPDDPWQQLATFAQPPRQQQHFAANLARLIVLALTQSEHQQAIFSQVMAGRP